MPLNNNKPGSSITDEQLIELHRAGDEQAFTALVERYRQELFHYLSRMTNKRSLADDVFQEAFLQVYLSLETFDTERRFRPWLFTIATNKARDQLRRNKRHDIASLSVPMASQQFDQERAYVDLLEADIPLPEEDMAREEMQSLIKKVVTDLPSHLREVLLLSYFHRFSYKEIAEMLQVPVGTVKSRLHTAVGTFAKRWKTSIKKSVK